jgi:dsDNA-binding SOS-regulon protein
MTNSKPILYDLGIAVGAVTLWLTPADLTRALGYTVSLLFSGRAYYTGVCLLSKEREVDEKKAIAYEAETDFYDQLLGTNIEATLEVKALEVENRMLERMLPLMQQKTQLERQLQAIRPIHPELSDEQREQAARSAIDDVFVAAESKGERPSQISEEDIRKQFPEQLHAASWKAILKALQAGAGKDEIAKDVLACNEQSMRLGLAYLELLKEKFL